MEVLGQGGFKRFLGVTEREALKNYSKVDAEFERLVEGVRRRVAALTPYEFICKRWAIEPEKFSLDPIHQMPGLNS